MDPDDSLSVSINGEHRRVPGNFFVFVFFFFFCSSSSYCLVADSRSARDGRAIDTIGHYNPRTDPIELSVDEAKARDWLAKGAQPSDTVRRLLKQAGVIPGLTK